MTNQNSTRTFVIDKAHSEVGFQVRHLVTRVRGRFAEFEGRIQFDQTNPAGSSVAVTIQASSVDTNEPKRDAHLRSADFFSVDEYPKLTFTSRSVKAKGGDSFEVAGDLAIRGITKPVALRTTFLGVAKDPWGNERIGFEAEVELNRKDFGLMWNATLETGGFLVGDEVKVALSVQAVAA